MTNRETKQSVFQRWLLNNKIISSMLIILLLLAIIYMFDKVNFIFEPIVALFSAVGAPIIIAGVFYYLLNPIVDWAERRYKMSRVATITVQFLVLLVLIVWGLAVFIPWLSDQIVGLINHWPEYWRALVKMIDQLTSDKRFADVNKWFNQTNSDISKWVQNYSAEYAKKGIHGVSSVVGTLTSAIITIVTFPLILFYLLKDGHQMPNYMAKFLPPKARGSFLDTIGEINKQISNYIRGQLSVAFAVMVMFAIGYTIIGLPYGWLIAISAGLLNLIPFLGSFLAMVPAVVVGLFVSPMMLVYVFIVFMIEQTLEGKVIAPKLLGNSLKVHPVTVVVILLSAGNIFGLAGVVFGIPGYAIAKVLIYRLYKWWQLNSGLFRDETNQ
ncbi:AI-2E family transporter [Weissella cibaria]|uniref:AI-2E family transporter n=1 Tax=Weissella cibaria TaxID=137591 RepID=A0A9Q8JI16_9LACO|nr:AI-2E family transporter [Weissella cibaria]QDG80311.1 AI-2E family transporter [Weissella cibaria]QMU87498.1 AI-2E family transporter [Weissella cibaria]TVV27723.1 AI-2E family transporter [Weissella cibaria]TVV35863.1 AI-2E family transporter [Weissella cibaria]TVV40915.1 AI-2E family transporter [Weissella cibaria]